MIYWSPDIVRVVSGLRYRSYGGMVRTRQERDALAAVIAGEFSEKTTGDRDELGIHYRDIVAETMPDTFEDVWRWKPNPAAALLDPDPTGSARVVFKEFPPEIIAAGRYQTPAPMSPAVLAFDPEPTPLADAPIFENVTYVPSGEFSPRWRAAVWRPETSRRR